MPEIVGAVLGGSSKRVDSPQPAAADPSSPKAGSTLTLAGKAPNPCVGAAGWRRGYAADCKSVGKNLKKQKIRSKFYIRHTVNEPEKL